MEVSTLSPLQDLYVKSCLTSPDPLSRLIVRFLQGELSADSAVLLEFDGFKPPSHRGALPFLEVMDRQLALWMVAFLDPSQASLADSLRSKTWEFENVVGAFKEFQLGAAYSQLVAYFSGRSACSGAPIVGKTGAAPIEASGFWKWADLPHQRYHSQLGTFWVWIAQLTGNKKLMSAALKLAEWHLNTLGHQFRPSLGLFTQEIDASFIDILTWNFLLYFSLGTLNSHARFLHVAERQLALMEELATREQVRIPVLAPLIEKWVLGHKKGPPSEGFVLDPLIHDEERALVGLRSESGHVVCTLSGGYTGLGTLLRGDLEVVTYGPQRSPYGDCASFGVLNFSSDAVVSWGQDAFSIEGTVKIPGEEMCAMSIPLPKNCGSSTLWADVKQEYREHALTIDLLLMGYEVPKNLAFVFYVKASQCLVHSSKVIHPRSLDRYEGVVRAVELVGEKGSLQLVPAQQKGTMEVIPLSGGSSFWGADFLIGFTLDPSQPNYSWKLCSR